MQAKKMAVSIHGVAQGAAIASMMLASVAFAGEGQIAKIIEKALQKHGPDVHRCFEKALADRMDVAGHVEIEVEVGKDGRAKTAKVLPGKQAAPAALSTCVQKVATTWVLEGIEDGATVVLPFSFRPQMNQFVVKAEDVPELTLGAAPSGKAKSAPKRAAPFTVKVLADETNMHATAIALTQLNIGPASRVAMHRHPKSAKVLYLLKGHARLLGPTGVTPLKLDEGMAAFVPAGYPHVIENMGRQSTAVLLQAFAPPGPERVYRDPSDARGRADFEVIRNLATAKLPPEANGRLVAAAAADVVATPIQGGKGSSKALLDPKTTGSGAIALNLLEFSNGAGLLRHDHGRSTEILYLASGTGKLTVGSEAYSLDTDSVVYLPAGQPHALTFALADKTDKGDKIVAIQFLTAVSTPAAPASPKTDAKPRSP